MSRLRAALATPATVRLPRDHGHLALIDASYGYLRQFTPEVLRVLRFAGGPSATELLDAVEVLRGLNATGTRSGPADAPAGFVPVRWRGYLDRRPRRRRHRGLPPLLGAVRAACACAMRCAAVMCTCLGRGVMPIRPPT